MVQNLCRNLMRLNWLLLLLLFSSACAFSQTPDTLRTKDSIPVIANTKPVNKYDSATLAHSPKKAALRSAMLPGLGQIYNKKYWKLPIVYGALGACAGYFYYSLTSYRDLRFAYRVRYNMRNFGTDSLLFPSIKPQLQLLNEESLRFQRNLFRRDIDYTVLVFTVLWGLNVVDAAVDAHLKSF